MLRRIKEKFQDLKLSRKIMLAYGVFAAVFFSASLLALQVSLGIYDEKLYEKSLQELDYFTQEVNRGLGEIEDLSYTIAMDTEIQERLSNIMKMDASSDGYVYEMYRFRSLLINETNLHPIVTNVVYTDKRKTKLKVGVDCGEVSEEAYLELLEDFDEKRGGYVTKDPSQDYPYFLSGRDILEKSNASLKYLGSIILTSDIAGMINGKNDELEAPHSSLFVYNGSYFIYGDPGTLPWKPSPDSGQGYEIIRHQGEKYFICYLKSSETGWMYVNMFPYSEIYGQTNMVRYWLAASFLILFMITLAAMRKISRVIMKPLDSLTESMHIAEQGDFQGALAAIGRRRGKDEVGRLSQNFEEMLCRIDRLIDEDYKKQILLKDTKYKALQAQINPHFLYNTLNSLHWMVKAGQNGEAGKMIVRLGDLLRASFSEDPCITVEEELQVVKSYIAIQQLRYQSRAEFEVAAQGELSSYIMPRMTLQPLVENAIYYGVDKTCSVCRVSVLVEEEEDSISFWVRDTGQGMTESELEAVRSMTVTPKGHGIGLKNIRDRLDIMFKDNEFRIESAAGQGTEIYIRIPKVRRENV